MLKFIGHDLKKAARKGQFNDADMVNKKKSKTKNHIHLLSRRKQMPKKTFSPKIPDAAPARLSRPIQTCQTVKSIIYLGSS